MSSSILTILLWAAALSSGLIAGVYFAFSTFIMPAFAKIETTQSIAAMNSINKIILHSLFMPLFFGSSIISVVLIIFSFIHWGEDGSALTFITGIIYFIGMFLCTVVFNVPLNNALARTALNENNTQQIWSHYLKGWTKWNHLRTVSSLITCVLSIWILSAQ